MIFSNPVSHIITDILTNTIAAVLITFTMHTWNYAKIDKRQKAKNCISGST